MALYVYPVLGVHSETAGAYGVVGPPIGELDRALLPIGYGFRGGIH